MDHSNLCYFLNSFFDVFASWRDILVDEVIVLDEVVVVLGEFGLLDKIPFFFKIENMIP